MLALIDGDVLAYQACRARWEKKALIQDGVSFIRLDENGKRIPLEFTAEEDRYYLEESWENFQRDLEKLLEEIFCVDYLMVVKGEDNFRNLLFPEYKMNRHKDPNKQNQFVPTLRKLAVVTGLAVFADGREADDILRIWAEECRKYNREYVVCTIDKDLRCIPGKYYDMKNKEMFEISEQEAMRFYYEQLLKGDPTDNIPGIPKVGPIKAKQMLAGCVTEDDFQTEVVAQYMTAYGDLWEEALLLMGKMIHLQRSYDDYFSLKDWEVAQFMKGRSL